MTDSKAERFTGTGKFIQQSLHFLFLLGGQVTVIGTQKISIKSLECRRFSREASNVEKFTSLGYRIINITIIRYRKLVNFSTLFKDTLKAWSRTKEKKI